MLCFEIELNSYHWKSGFGSSFQFIPSYIPNFVIHTLNEFLITCIFPYTVRPTKKETHKSS